MAGGHIPGVSIDLSATSSPTCDSYDLPAQEYLRHSDQQAEVDITLLLDEAMRGPPFPPAFSAKQSHNQRGEATLDIGNMTSNHAIVDHDKPCSRASRAMIPASPRFR